MKDTITITLRITKKQKEWMKKNNISPSLIFQAFLDDQMKISRIKRFEKLGENKK